MRIREAEERDIPEILRVLKASLGETSSKKTEEIWRYKHLDNPFGKSLVLLAEEDSVIIGVRAFMRWQWKKNDKTYSCFRVVDTATHPEHQGKGIFKKLTLEAIKTSRNLKTGYKFNTYSRTNYMTLILATPMANHLFGLLSVLLTYNRLG